MTKTQYIISVGIVTFLLQLTGISTYYVSSLVFYGLEFYVEYDTVKIASLICMPIIAVLLAFFTGYRKKGEHYTVFDCLMVAMLPILLFMNIRLLQYPEKYLILSGMAFLIPAVFILYQRHKVLQIPVTKNRDATLVRKKRKQYVRACAVPVMTLFYGMVIIPTFIHYSQFQKNMDDSMGKVWNLLWSEDAAKEQENVPIDICNLEEFRLHNWSNMKVEERLAVIRTTVDYQTNKLGIADVPVKTIREATEETLACFSPAEKEIFINVVYLASAPIDEVYETICHEVYHAYEYEIIDLIQDLKKNQEVDIARIPYFDQASLWETASKTYSFDQAKSYEEYYNNDLEVSAREYAAKESKELASIYDWRN